MHEHSKPFGFDVLRRVHIAVVVRAARAARPLRVVESQFSVHLVTHVAHRARGKPWPSDLDLTAAPSLVHELKDAGLWLEQETIILDPRLPTALEKAAREASQQAERSLERG